MQFLAIELYISWFSKNMHHVLLSGWHHYYFTTPSSLGIEILLFLIDQHVTVICSITISGDCLMVKGFGMNMILATKGNVVY